MIETGPINADGVYNLNDGNPTEESEGTVKIINPDGGHTYTLGVLSDDGTFVAYIDGVLTTNDIHVLHGKGARLAISVAGVSGGDDLLVGYFG